MSNTDWTAIATRLRAEITRTLAMYEHNEKPPEAGGILLPNQPIDTGQFLQTVLALAEAERMVVIQKQEDHDDFKRNVHGNLYGPKMF